MNDFNFVVCYSKGGDYTAEDVKKLQYNIKLVHPEVNFVVYGDDDDARQYCDEYIPLESPWSEKSWWCCVEAFRHADKNVLFFGLDTVLLGRVDELIETIINLQADEVVMLRPFNRNFYRRGWMASGVIGWNSDFSFVHNSLTQKVVAKYRMEEEYTTRKLKKSKVIILPAQETVENHGIWSFKRHYCPVRQGDGEGRWDYEELEPKILMFHGNPRPSQLENPNEIHRVRYPEKVNKVLKMRGVL